jgi:(2Fe-2S) ferredoxin
MDAQVRHLFVCTNRRKVPLSCGLRTDTGHVADLLAQKIETLTAERAADETRPGLSAHVGTTRCLGRCPNGPVVAVYPDKVWYTYTDEQDLDEIVEEHLGNGRVVRRLAISYFEGPATAQRKEETCP